VDQAAPLPEWRADHSAARVLLAITGQQRLEGALIGGAREELLTIDQIEQAHWLAAQGMDDVPVVDQVAELLSPGRSPILEFAPDSALEQARFELPVPPPKDRPSPLSSDDLRSMAPRSSLIQHSFRHAPADPFRRTKPGV